MSHHTSEYYKEWYHKHREQILTRRRELCRLPGSHARKFQRRDGFKWCPNCQQFKTPDNFYKNKCGYLGRSNWCIICTKESYQTRKVKINAAIMYKYRNDVPFHLAHRLRARLNKLLSGKWKSGSAVRDLGCTLSEFKKYIENLWQPGMSWVNRNKWHLDHIKPLVSFNLTDREQFLQACHYTNYQPLWAEDNLKKNKY